MKHVIFAFFLISTFGNAWSQTDEEIIAIKKETNVSALQEMSKRLDKENQVAMNNLLKLSKVHGWKFNKVSKNGEHMRLIGVDVNLNPIYVTVLGKYTQKPNVPFNGKAYMPFSIEAGITGRINKLYTGGGLGLNLHGESMTAGVWEITRTQTNHEGFLDPVSLQTRVIQKDNSTKSPTNTDPPYHSNIVAGMVIASKPYFVQDSIGSRTVDNLIGSAFKGNVNAYDWDNQFSEISAAASQGLLVSNHSYVWTNIESRYAPETAKLDSIMFFAPYYLSVWACGNTGGISDVLNNASTAKNGLAVGATKYVPNYTGPSDVIAMSIGTTVSSRGPSDDGRVKPDIVTQGEKTRSTYIAGTTTRSTITTSGTSNSAPSVTGAVLLLQQHYVNNHPLKFMRASTTKALLLHTTDEAGAYPGPDITFGWGLLNAERAANLISSENRASYILESNLAQSSTFSRDLIASGDEPLIATLVWTDVPGAPSLVDNSSTPNLVNDLDLRITKFDTTYYPWKLDISNVTGPAIRGDNVRDNVEKIEIQNPIPGQSYKLSINHKGSLIGNSQNFSLTISGLKDCVANRIILSEVNNFVADYQESSISLLAKNILNTNSEVIYHAGEEVILSEGFTGLSGTSFHGYVEGCTNEYNLRKSTPERPVVTYPLSKKSKEIELRSSFVYPNPGNGLFNVNLMGLKEGTLHVIDRNGVELFKESFANQEEMQIDLKDSLSGIYLIRINSAGKVYTKKIVKN